MPTSLEKWKKIYKEAKPKIGLKTSIKIKTAQGWYFDEQPDKKTITLYCPAYNNLNKGPFVHYLGHAKLLEDGWPRIDITVSLPDDQMKKMEKVKDKDDVLFYWASRSADAFFDFYVWQYLLEKGLDNYAKFFVRRVGTGKDLKPLIKRTEQELSILGLPYHFYTFCLDWLSSCYFVAQKVDPETADYINRMYSLILKSKKIQDAFPIDFEKRITWLRNFYTNCVKKYPLHYGFVKNKKTFSEVFLDYYKKIWQGFGIEVEIQKLRQRK